MNRFTVTWSPDAEAELAELYNTAPFPQAVSDAANWIERHLATDPFPHSQHLSEGLFRIAVKPVAVLFSVDLPDRTVRVIKCRRERTSRA